MFSYKNSPIILLSLVLLAGCADSKSNSAQDLQSHLEKNKAYQATYSAPTNFAYQTEHFYSDGNGRYRIDLSGQGPTVVNVLDQNTGETIMWTEETKEYARRPSQPMDPLVMRVNLQKLDKSGAEPLGEKTINGHKCHGWKQNGTEVWLDEDFGCHVTATAGGVTSTMTEFSDRAPDPSVFQPPPGYTQIATRQPLASRRRSDNSRFINDAQRFMH